MVWGTSFMWEVEAEVRFLGHSLLKSCSVRWWLTKVQVILDHLLKIISHQQMSWLHPEEFREVTENIYLILLYKLPVRSLNVLGTIKKKIRLLAQIHIVMDQNCNARCPKPPTGKDKTSMTMQHAKEGKFIADSSQGPCCNQPSGAKSESPEPQFPRTFIGCSISNISSG